MTIARPRQRARHEAAALRFLLFSLGGWATLRALMLWSPVVPAVPAGMPAPWVPASFAPFAAPLQDDPGVFGPIAQASSSSPRWHAAADISTRDPAASFGIARLAVPSPTSSGGFGDDRHALRLALMARTFPASGVAAAVPPRVAFEAASPAAIAPLSGGEPFWMQRRSLAGWSLGGWVYLRQGSSGSPGSIATGGQLGGSQAGLRVAYGLADEGRLRAYARATMAVAEPNQRELALGLAFAPVKALPVDISVEQRVAVGRAGRTALAAFVSGGLSDVALPAGFRLDGYAQVGVVGARRRDGFADGAISVDRSLGAVRRAPVRIGALIAGAAQPGAARVDIGPRISLQLPDVGEGGRVSLDWRQRVAGDARPASGLALTLAADF